MSKQELPFKGLARIFVLMLAVSVMTPSASASGAAEARKQETGLIRDIIDQNVYYEGTSYLRLDRLYRAIFRKAVRSRNVNVFDEVADSSFFTNRHYRQRMSAGELRRGYVETEGPAAGPLEVIRGKFEGLHPGFFVRDSRGDEYLLKFDPFDYFELTTSAEIIASRFYHALGYNVPQYTVESISPDRLKVAEGARILDDSGFKKPLTQDKLDEYMLFIPRNDNGDFRASASKVLSGRNLGYFDFQGTRSEDPDDRINHEHRRELRALEIFSGWINNSDIRQSNTLDMLVQEDGREFIRHYLIDFNSALGAAANGPKPPMFGYEHMIDYGETAKAILSLGFWQKPWQKKWEMNEREISTSSPAVGYFDNKLFDPASFKTQLPFYAFKNITRADGFWAAKIMQSFSDEDIRAMVEAGELSRPEDTDYLVRTLVERRDIIVSYWFAESNPLDNFRYQDGTLVFDDLAVNAGYADGSGTRYHYVVLGKSGNRGREIASGHVSSPSIDLQPSWFEGSESIDLLIRTTRPGHEKPSPYVLVEADRQGIRGIMHED